jgi:O-antigen ligase
MTSTFQWRQRLVLLAGLAATVGATGIVEAHLFHRPSTLKYALTVAGPLFIGLLATVGSPLVVITAVLVLVAPFAGFSMTFSAVHIPLLAPLMTVAVVVVAFSEPPSQRRSALSIAGLIALLTFVIPVVESPIRTDVIAVLASLFLCAYFAARVSTTSNGFLVLVWAFVCSAAIQAGLAIWEHTTGHRLNLYGTAGSQTFGANSGYFFGFVGGTYRPPGAFYDPISLGNMLAIAVVMCAGLAIQHVRARQRALGVIALVALGIIGFGLEVSLSRMSWVGAASGLVASAVILPPRVRGFVLPLLVLAVVVPALVGVFSGSSAPLQRLSSITHPLNESRTHQGDVVRLEIWQRALSVTVKHPVAGVGFGRFERQLAANYPPAGTNGQAQSTYLQVAVEGGILALAGLLTVLVALGRDLTRVTRHDRVWGAILAGCCVAMLVTWVSDVTIRYSGVAAFTGILFGMVAGRSRSARAVADRLRTLRRPSIANAPFWFEQ